jgi:hypothetical protein
VFCAFLRELSESYSKSFIFEAFVKEPLEIFKSAQHRKKRFIIFMLKKN